MVAASSQQPGTPPLLFEYDTVRCQKCLRWCHFECCNIDAREAQSVTSFSCKECDDEVVYDFAGVLKTKTATPSKEIEDSDEEEEDDKGEPRSDDETP